MIINYVPFMHIYASPGRWNIKCRVLRLVQLMGLENGLRCITNMKMVLIDQWGEVMQARVDPDMVDYWKARSIQEGKVYGIVGAEVRAADEKFRIVSNEIQLYFGEEAFLKEEFDDCSDIPRDVYQLMVKLVDIPHFVNDQKHLIDVIGFVVFVGDIHTLNTNDNKHRQVVLVDKSMKMIRLTIWDNFRVNEGYKLFDEIGLDDILVACSLSVKCHNGPCLSTTKCTSLYVNRPFEQTYNIQNWYTNDRCAQKMVGWFRGNGLSLTQSLMVANAIRVDIGEFISYAERCIYRITAEIISVDVKDVWFDTCASCKILVGGYTNTEACLICNKNYGIETHYLLVVIARDYSGTQQLLLTGKQAEFLMGCKASDLKQMAYQKNGEEIVQAHVASVVGEWFSFIIPGPQHGKPGKQFRPTVKFVLRIDYEEETLHLQRRRIATRVVDLSKDNASSN